MRLPRSELRFTLPELLSGPPAALAWVAAGAGWSSWAAGLLWGCAWLLMIRRARGAVAGGSGAATQVLLTGAVAAWLDRVDAPDGVVWGAALLLALAVVLAPLEQRIRPGVDVVGLPGVPDAVPARGRRVPVLAALLVGALAACCATVRPSLSTASALVWAAAALGACAMGVRDLGVAATARRRRGSRDKQVRAALERYAPAFAVYTGRLDGGNHQIEMWLPFLRQAGVPFVVVLRSSDALAELGRLTGVPVLVRSSWRDLDLPVVPSLRAALYVNATSTNANFVGYRQLTHAYLGHGESDKPLSYHPSHAMYDKVFVAGQAAIDRYAEHGVLMRPEAFEVVGRPQTRDLDVGPRARQGPDDTVRVLYAPTWAGYNGESSCSSLGQGEAIVTTLLGRGVDVEFRPHPFSRSRAAERPLVDRVDALLAADARRSGRRHILSAEAVAQPFHESANRCDALVCDVSSVLSDFLATTRPVAVVADAPAGSTLHGAYVVRPDLSGLDLAVEQMLGADPRCAERAAARDHLLGGLSPADAERAFVAALTVCLDPASSAAGRAARRPAGHGSGGLATPD